MFLITPYLCVLVYAKSCELRNTTFTKTKEFFYDRKAKFSKSDIFKKKKKKKFDDSNRVIKRRKLEDSQYYDGKKMANIDLKIITQTTKD